MVDDLVEEIKPEKVLSLQQVVEKAERIPKGRGDVLPNGLRLLEENFAQEFSTHADVARASHAAGLKTDGKGRHAATGTKMLQDEKVLERIEEIRQMAATRNNLTIDTVIQMIKATYEQAMLAQKFEAANGATKMLYDYLGMTSPKKPLTIIREGGEMKRLAAAAGFKVVELDIEKAVESKS